MRASLGKAWASFPPTLQLHFLPPPPLSPTAAGQPAVCSYLDTHSFTAWHELAPLPAISLAPLASSSLVLPLSSMELGGRVISCLRHFSEWTPFPSPYCQGRVCAGRSRSGTCSPPAKSRTRFQNKGQPRGPLPCGRGSSLCWERPAASGGLLATPGAWQGSAASTVMWCFYSVLLLLAVLLLLWCCLLKLELILPWELSW